VLLKDIQFVIVSNKNLILKIEMPPKRKILILLNPFSGHGAAAANWEVARVILEKCYVDMTIIRTERA